MAPVDSEGDVGIHAGAEHWERAGVRIHREHLIGGEFKPAVRHVGQMAGEEREPGSSAVVPGRHRGDGEPEGVMNSREDLGFVLEVVERQESVAVECVGEEGGGGLVGCEASRGDDSGGTGGRGDRPERLGEHAVGVDVALPRQGISATTQSRWLVPSEVRSAAR